MPADSISYHIVQQNIVIRTPGSVPTHWRRLWPQSHGGWADASVPDMVIRVEPRKDWFSGYDTNGNYEVFRGVDHTLQRLRVEHPYFVGEFESLPNGKLSGVFSVRQNDVIPFMVFMRMSVATLLEYENFFLLHASGVIRHQKLWLFTGPMQTGKTTIATELNDGGRPFAIDRVAVGMMNSGGLTQLWARSTPFSDEENRFPPSILSWPVAGIFLIEQSQQVTCEPAALEEAMSKLLHELLLIQRDDFGRQNLLQNIFRWLENTPVRLLRFTRDERFWGMIDELKIK